MAITPRWFVFCLLSMIPFMGRAQQTSEVPLRPKVALVLSGGGAKGLAHIGVLKVLEEEGIPIDIVVGTSMGSLIGGVYAIGYNASEIETLVKSMDWETTLSDKVERMNLSKNAQILKQRYLFSLPISQNKQLTLPQGIIKGQNVLNLFCGLTGNVPENADFNTFPIQFACVATNIESGQEVVMNSGSLPTAMFSSMAIPIAFQHSNRAGKLLVDGGLVNNFPANVARNMGADILIGVDVPNDFEEQIGIQSMNSIFYQLVNFLVQEKDSTNKNLCNLVIQPDITGYTMSSFNRLAVDTLIERGKVAANSFRQELRDLKNQYGLKPRTLSRNLVKPDYWHITRVTFSGNNDLEDDFLRKRLHLEIPGNYSSDQLKAAIDRLYGMGGFDQIYYNLVDDELGKVLNLNIVSAAETLQRIGFKANTTDVSAIMINLTRKNYKRTFGMLSASLELSANPGFSFTAESSKTNLPTIGINLKGKSLHFNVFDNGDLRYKSSVLYSATSLYLDQPFLNRFNTGMGLQEEYFHGNVFSKNDDIPISYNKMSRFITSVYTYLSFDNVDDYYFPKSGTMLYTEFSMMGDVGKRKSITPVLLFRMNNYIPVAQQVTILFSAYNRSLFNADFPLSKTTMVGGEAYSHYFNSNLPFIGLSAVNLADRFTTIGLVGLRIKLFDTHYISLLGNTMLQADEIDFWNQNAVVHGVGLRYSLRTILGPLEVTLGYSGASEKPNVSMNLGCWF